MEDYYRKLRPSGARVVRRRVGVGDWVDVVRGWEGGAGERGEDVEREDEGRVIGKGGDRDG